MNYFEIKTDRAIRDELRSVRKNQFQLLIPTARSIKQNKTNVEGIDFLVQGKTVSASQFADLVLEMESARIEKQGRETKLIWIQQGAASFSGYYKRIKAA
jgi:hypothetical protein